MLDRLTFGARPGEVDRVLAQGLEIWVERQLTANLMELPLATSLEPYPAVAMDQVDLALTYPPRAQLVRMAELQNVVTCAAYQGERKAVDALGNRVEEPDGPQVKLEIWAEANGFRPQEELTWQLLSQKVLRARYAENQLQEVLTDFWYNHFNVSWHDLKGRGFMLPYERDAIRPNVFGSFRALLGATAHHPAMLTYLDNAQSRANDGAPLAFEEAQRTGFHRESYVPEEDDLMGQGPQQAPGLNENYARELLELHTLGVDGGYDQRDVVDIARAFTGWTVVSHRRVKEDEQTIRRGGSRDELGFVQDGLFLFRPDKHDAGPKTVLGTELPPGRGDEDGLAVLDLLAEHPSTARHVARKLAFRAVDATVRNPRAIVKAVAKMGQPLYSHQAPAGFPDRADAWVNSGALLARMNFGMELATEQLRGTDLDPPKLTRGAEPASVEEALATYRAILLPEREAAGIGDRHAAAAGEGSPASSQMAGSSDGAMETTAEPLPQADSELAGTAPGGTTMLAQVIGVILGSPEVQRR